MSAVPLGAPARAGNEASWNAQKRSEKRRIGALKRGCAAAGAGVGFATSSVPVEGVVEVLENATVLEGDGGMHAFGSCAARLNHRSNQIREPSRADARFERVGRSVTCGR